MYILRKYYCQIKISSGEKNYKYFIGYFYNDHKVKQLQIMLQKASTYVKS